MTGHTSPSGMRQEDRELLGDIRALFSSVDPPPDDLVVGVLARLATEQADLEYELLTLVENADPLVGARATALNDHVWVLEYRSDTCQVRLRIAATDQERRIDGWVVTDEPMQIRLEPWDGASAIRAQQTSLDEHGRFAFADTGTGQARVLLTPDSGGRPIVTPPFTV